MRLHDFIAANKARVLEEWVAFARSCSPVAHTMDALALRDHAGEMIDAIVDDLRQEQTSAQQRLKSLGKRDAQRTIDEYAEEGTAAQSHGAGRARGGFSIEQMVSEYRALRASVLRLWLSESAPGLDQVEDLMRFNEAIDQALAESVASFARVVESALREARTTLETRVEDRTRQLTVASTALLAQVKEAERAEQDRIALLRYVLKAQEDEQRRIARDLHDQFGQQITALGLKVRALRSQVDLQTEAAVEIEKIEQIVRQLDNDVDFLVWQLRPTALDDLGLVEAISDYVRNWSLHSGVNAQVDVRGMEATRLSAEIETVLFRVTQEALNNVAKHAGAGSVTVELDHGTDATVLTIADDGSGFDIEKHRQDRHKHFGLDGMRERAALVGGSVAVEGSLGRGTRICVRIPCAKE